jgi:ficolin
VLILDVFHYTVILFKMFYFSTGDSMAKHYGRAFSTKDRDNDTSRGNCAAMYKGAWWYHSCHDVNINGLYLGNKVDNRGMRWTIFKGRQSMKTTSMMMGRTSNNN